jgi:hypothetical protein
MILVNMSGWILRLSLFMMRMIMREILRERKIVLSVLQ